MKLTKTNKIVSDLLVQYSEQCSRVMEINETETRKLYFMTCRILRESIRRKINSTTPIKLAEFAIPYIINKKEYEKRVRAYRDKNQYLESSLDDALKRIQKTNARELFKIIEMNMKSDSEKTIEYVMKSLHQKKRIEINYMAFMSGEIRKAPQ